MDNTFYGKNFEKIRLYCKIKTDASIKIRRMYKQDYDVTLNFISDKYYKVQEVNFDDKSLIVLINFTKPFYDLKLKDDIIIDEDKIKVCLDYEQVEFGFFLEYTSEEEYKKSINDDTLLTQEELIEKYKGIF